MARRALLAVGGDDGDLAERLRGLEEAGQSVRENSIVVGEEESDQRAAPVRWRQIVATTRIASRHSRKWLVDP